MFYERLWIYLFKLNKTMIIIFFLLELKISILYLNYKENIKF